MSFQQIKTGKNNKTFITDEVIDSIAEIKAFEDAQMNKYLYNHHKQLLRISKNKNQSEEYGFFWDLEHFEKDCLKIRGNAGGFSMNDNPAVMKLVKENPILSVVVMHNHSRNGLFSYKDIESFCDFDSIFLMTAVCNDGTIYMMRKETDFNALAMQRYYNEGAAISKNKTTDDIIRKIKKLKLDMNNPKDREKIKTLSTKPYYNGIKNVAKHTKEIGITYRCSVRRKGGIICNTYRLERE